LTLACHRLVLPPALDPLLCGESSSLVDYRDPCASAASGGGGAFDNPDTRLSGFEGAYVLVLRGRCSFESKARSAHRLGALGVVVRNTLDWRYVPPPSANGGMGGMRRRRGPWRCGITSAATALRRAGSGSGPRSIRRRSTSTPPRTGMAGPTAPTTGCLRGLARGATSAHSSRQRQRGDGGDVRIALPWRKVPPHRSQRHVGPGMA
jgi:hypothetical protein